MGEAGPLHAHHVVERSVGAGWKHLHDPDINGASLCPICHGEIHDHRAKDWERWLLSLASGELRALRFEVGRFREDWQLVARIRWSHAREFFKREGFVVMAAVRIVHQDLELLTTDHRSALKSIERRLSWKPGDGA